MNPEGGESVTYQQTPVGDSGFAIIALSLSVHYTGTQQCMTLFCYVFNIFVGPLWNVASLMVASQKADPQSSKPSRRHCMEKNFLPPPRSPPQKNSGRDNQEMNYLT